MCIRDRRQVTGPRDHRVARGRIALPRTVDDLNRGAVALVHEHQSLSGQTKLGGHRRAVRLDCGRFVTDVTGQVELSEGCRAHPAVAVGDGHVDTAAPFVPEEHGSTLTRDAAEMCIRDRCNLGGHSLRGV